MNVLVTGGTGYLGRAVVRALAAHGHTPVVFSRRPPEGRGLRHVTGDVRDRDAVGRGMDGCEAVCHLAARVSIVDEPAETEAVNVGGLRAVLDVARDRGARVVYTSSFLASPPSGARVPLEANAYQRTKVRALRVAREAAAAGDDVVIVSPGVVYGPGVRTEGNLVGRLLEDHLARRLPGIVGGDRVWSFSYVEDVAAGHVAALARGTRGVEYALGGPNLPQRSLFEWLHARTGRALPFSLPYGLAALAGWLEERRVSMLGGTPLVTSGVVRIFRHDWPLDSALALRELGYHVTSLRDGLDRLWPDLARPRGQGEAP